MASPLVLIPGAVFAGDYRIIRPLSQGGMGVVYVAEQLSTSRERALKVMLPGLTENADLRRRFVQEAKIGAQIESEHVVEVVGAGIDEASQAPWLAMELLAGEDLAALMQRSGPLAPALVRELFEQLTHALGAAHEKGIVHRDLKPENLFLARTRRTGSSFMLKVLDFGIAKMMDAARTSATGAMGTPLWMAPEQAESGASVRASADVWAMGLIAFHALTAKSFWRSASAPDASPITVLREVAFEAIPPASHRAAELAAAPLPSGFDAWFERCVHRTPAARFQGARDAFAALAQVLDHAGPGASEARPLAPGPSAPARSHTVAAAPVVSPVVARTYVPASAAVRSNSGRVALIVAGVAMLAAIAVGVVIATKGPSAERQSAAEQAGAPSDRPAAPIGTPSTSSPTLGVVAPPPAASSSPPAIESATNTPGPPVATRPPTSPTAPLPVTPAPTATPSQAEGTATLNVNSIPVSKVVLDGRPLGSTPRMGISVPPGMHTVVFIHPELGKKSVTVSIEAGETKTAAVRFNN